MYVDNFLARVATIDPTINQLEKFGIINVDALLYNLGQDKIYKLTLKSSIRWFIMGGGSTNLMAIVPEGRYIISNIVWQYCTTTESFITNLIILIQIRQAEHWLQNVASPNRGEKYRRLHGEKHRDVTSIFLSICRSKGGGTTHVLTELWHNISPPKAAEADPGQGGLLL